MTKKAGIITFHAAHNYGSVLQAFALFKTIEKLGLETEVINFRTTFQKKHYAPAYTIGKNLPEKIARRIFVGLYKSQINKKHDLFEQFIKTKFKLSAEFSSFDELKQNTPNYDFFIAGSDQIWNTSCPDFEWAYYLNFVKKGKKIAYAPSMGQRAIESFNPAELKQIKKYLELFDELSVRETETAQLVKNLLNTSPKLTLDPTFLLPVSDWEKICSPVPIVKENYIFYYSPRYQKEGLQIARKLSKNLNLPVVTSIIHSSKFVVLYPDFKKEIATGPAEFLNLCKNASLVIGDAYHLLVFALIFNVPFFSEKGIQKTRIKHLLGLTGLSHRSISSDDFEKKVNTAFDVDFSEVNQRLQNHKQESLAFLKDALEIDRIF